MIFATMVDVYITQSTEMDNGVPILTFLCSTNLEKGSKRYLYLCSAVQCLLSSDLAVLVSLTIFYYIW